VGKGRDFNAAPARLLRDQDGEYEIVGAARVEAGIE
jgi:hypothetical protein